MSITLSNLDSDLAPVNETEINIALPKEIIPEPSLEQALTQLLEHSEGKKALVEQKLKDIKIPEEELNSIVGSEFSEAQKQTIIDYKKKQICDTIDFSAYIKELVNNVVTADDLAAKQQAWQNLLDIILKAYYVARDDTAKFKTMRDMIEPLSIMVENFVTEFDGKLQNNPTLAAQGAQAFFRVANSYGMDDQTEVCSKWHNAAEKYIFNNGLDKTQELAILYNLRGGEISRRFPLYNKDGSLNSDPFPIECIYYFQKAVDLHHEIGSTLQNTPHMRHVLMCLASVKSQELRHRLHTREYTAELQSELKAEGDAVFNLLSELKPHIKDDGYRMGGTLQVESLLYMLQGDMSNAIEHARKALDHMPIKQTGQYSYALNNAGDLHVFMGAALYLSSKISEEIFKIMQNHPYALMAKKMHQAAPFKVAPGYSEEEIISIANTYLVVAMAAYVKSYQLSHDPDKPERTYADQAKNSLSQIGVEEEFIEMLYYDEDIQYFFKHCKPLNVAPGAVNDSLDHQSEVDGQKGITIGFFSALENAWNDLQAMLEPYNPFQAPKPTPKP